MYLNSFPFAQFFELFTGVGYVRDYNGGLVLGVVRWIIGVVGIVVGLLVGLGELEMPLVKGPRGELTVLEGCFDNQMCHPGFLPDPPQLPPLPAFLPHPWPPHLPPMQPATHPASRLPSSSTNTNTSHTCTNHMDKWVINLSGTPSPANSYPSSKKDLILPSPLNTPHRSLHNCNRTSIFQAINPGSR